MSSAIRLKIRAIPGVPIHSIKIDRQKQGKAELFSKIGHADDSIIIVLQLEQNSKLFCTESGQKILGTFFGKMEYSILRSVYSS